MERLRLGELAAVPSSASSVRSTRLKTTASWLIELARSRGRSSVVNVASASRWRASASGYSPASLSATPRWRVATATSRRESPGTSWVPVDGRARLADGLFEEAKPPA